MRALVIAVALIGAPVCVLAQPTSDTNEATEVSGVTVAAKRQVTELSGVTVAVHRATKLSELVVTAPCKMPPNNYWSEDAYEPAPQTSDGRIGPSPGLAEYLEQDIALVRKGSRNYIHMTPELREAARDGLSQARQRMKCLGLLKSIKFLYVTKRNLDDYEFEFQNGAMEWAVAPLTNGLSSVQIIRVFEPQPASKEVSALINSLQSGKPAYGDLTQQLASNITGQSDALGAEFKTWGRMRSLYFVRQNGDGTYLYDIGFDHSRTVWKVAFSPDNGKISSMDYQVLSGPSD